MKYGLEGRNNRQVHRPTTHRRTCLNEVRPRRPEQFVGAAELPVVALVSMKSGLEGRNNAAGFSPNSARESRLNEVRPRRPEQYANGR